MKIRPATIDDLDQLTELTIKFKTELVQYSPEYMLPYHKTHKTEEEIHQNINQEVINPKGLYLVAKEADQIIAFAFGTHKHTNHLLFKDVKFGTIDYLWINKEHRQNGIASMFKEKLKKWFKKENCQYINLIVLDKNPAKRVFKKWGFEKVLSLMRLKI